MILFNGNMYCPYTNPYISYNNFFEYGEEINAIAYIHGGPLAPNLKGVVYFKGVDKGTDVKVRVSNLPNYEPARNGNPPIGPHGFHIHENGLCEIGDPNDPFKSAGGHWNPDNQPHGNHAGDFPVLFSNNGYAEMSFFTNRFKPKDVIGKSIIIHQSPDDYRSQPAGDAGKRLACGVIQPKYY
ncbi:superoxide dismutase, Cu-Zn family [Proteiniborus ethanoligenes]|uniref:Superoxide dismutase [Cu-Zn] n=1 Tax=Proteiniborus ethanoligenes TaxID=415015 RepID=A0A1H3RTL2_9FIRM|nr:superoxide dismutase family protein [Proteiniborus ethanoligenes]SDZ28665.1 superoxide dismutase, Cu-Zn family [Proteiniborus ethanoligenes]